MKHNDLQIFDDEYCDREKYYLIAKLIPAPDPAGLSLVEGKKVLKQAKSKPLNLPNLSILHNLI